MSTCSSTVRSSFERAGFDYYKKGRLNYLKLNRQKIENSSGFRELWEIDFQEENLSARRRNQRRGWINEKYFPPEFKNKYNF